MTLKPRLEEHYLPIGCPACGRARLLCAGNYVRCEKCGAESDTLSDAQEELLRKAGIVEEVKPTKGEVT